ncbi:uncharacterized protein LOC124112505 isoform X2 [Haliotis rufescens]|uniref:uncharacterized protein LOC124112505 isoform X2 n=1 Tax=Haliotis rufescens TaxID=6454 RepID=UPI00201FAA5E|nr:uncharacterized protein LOC124112505 isoform X2 [Haliotis rufescens]
MIVGIFSWKQLTQMIAIEPRRKKFLLLLGVAIVTTAYLSWPYSVLNEETSQHASGSMSRLSLIGVKNTYELDETVKVNIVLFDHYKRPKIRGGDMLVVWMKDPQHGAASAGTVIDHGNGTYTGVLRTLWTGRAIIRAAMISSRERMAHIYRSFQNGYFGRNIACTFISNTATETTSGYMDMRYVKKRPFCNLTADYFGVPFYCEKPNTKGIRCHDWTETDSPNTYMTFGADTRWFEVVPVGLYHNTYIVQQTRERTHSVSLHPLWPEELPGYLVGNATCRLLLQQHVASSIVLEQRPR